MAHDFSLTRKSDRQSVYFFGFCGGIAYQAFNGQQFNGGMSGRNGGKFVSKDEAIKGVEAMIAKFKSYSDKYESEAKEFTTYLESVIKPSADDEQFEAHYS